MQNALFNLFFPNLCLGCAIILNDHEITICTQCRHDLPTTNFHFNEPETLKKVLYGRAKIEDASALFHFDKKGIVQNLLHELKYKKQEKVSHFLGEWLAMDLQDSNLFNAIDVVVPVPLHPSKLKKRGFNQVHGFASALGKRLRARVEKEVLIKIKSTKSQVNKNRLERWQLNNEAFSTKNLQRLNGKHILLVDDVITTGATIEACCNELSKAENVKISVATMAIA